MPKENKNDQQLYMIMYLIGYVFLLVLSLHAAHLMSTENVDFVNAYASSFVSFNSNPLGFLPFTFLLKIHERFPTVLSTDKPRRPTTRSNRPLPDTK